MGSARDRPGAAAEPAPGLRLRAARKRRLRAASGLHGLRGLGLRVREDAARERRDLVDPDHPGHRPRGVGRRLGRAQRPERQGARTPDGRGGLRARGRQGGGARLPDDRRRASGRRRDPPRGLALPGRPDRGRRAARPRGGLHAPLPDARRVEAGVRRPGLEADRRLPDPEPDPPRPRVPDQGRARGLRRALPASADRRDEVGRHPRRRADALLRGPDGPLLPPGAGDPRRQPGEDALRGPPGGGAARDHPPQLRLHPLHRRSRPRRGRRLLRHLRRAADLRRHRHRRARDPAPVLRAHVLVPRVRGHGLRQDLPAPAGVAPVPIRYKGARDARPAARPRRTSSPGKRLPRS